MHGIEPLALLSLVAVCFVLLGALLVAGPLTIDQRAAGLAAIATVLFGVAWRARHRRSE